MGRLRLFASDIRITIAGIRFKLQLLFINLASVPGGQLVNSQLQPYANLVGNFRKTSNVKRLIFPKKLFFEFIKTQQVRRKLQYLKE